MNFSHRKVYNRAYAENFWAWASWMHQNIIPIGRNDWRAVDALGCWNMGDEL
jgi:hypothetical protein